MSLFKPSYRLRALGPSYNPRLGVVLYSEDPGPVLLYTPDSFSCELRLCCDSCEEPYQGEFNCPGCEVLQMEGTEGMPLEAEGVRRILAEWFQAYTEPLRAELLAADALAYLLALRAAYCSRYPDEESSTDEWLMTSRLQLLGTKPRVAV